MKPRRLILSRKGFDSKYGGCPSPIFPGGTMYSLPIPGGYDDDVIRYQDLYHGNINIGRVVEDLTGGRHKAGEFPHFDPDVLPNAIPRRDGWRGLFGQASAAEGHLENQGAAADGDFAYVQRRGPGQEFPLDLVQYPEATGWLSSLVQDFGAIDA